MKIFYLLHPHIVRFLESRSKSNMVSTDISLDSLNQVLKILDYPRELLAERVYPLFEKSHHKELLSKTEHNLLEQLRLQLSQYIAHHKQIKKNSSIYQ